MRPRIFPLAMLALAVGTGPASAGLLPSVDVPAMAAAADLIVVGRAEAVRFADGAAGAEQTFSIVVDRVLKGSRLRAGERVAVRLDLSRLEFGVVKQRRHGIFFLRRAAPRAAYAAANPYHPALAAAPGRERAGPDAADPQAAVARELTRVLAMPPAELAGDGEEAETLYYGAAAALKTLPFAVAGPRLRAVADSDAMPGRLWAIECLLMMGGPDEHQKLKTAYLQSVKSLLLDPPPGLESAAYALATANRAANVPTLAAFLENEAEMLRRWRNWARANAK